MNNKKNLLKLKKALLVATMSSMTTLTACAPIHEAKSEKKVESNEEFQSNIYTDENGNLVYEVKPYKISTEKGEIYTIPNGYELLYDENNKPYGKMVIEKKKTR